MVTLFSANFLARINIEKAMKSFGEQFKNDDKVLDIGCGYKPYLSFFKCKYVGLDFFPGTEADIIANAWKIPSADCEYDGIILNQSLEHIQKTDQTIKEIKRVLKPGGIGIITAPQTMKNHSIAMPSEKSELKNFDKKSIRFWNNDYYRFTKFGMIYLFREFEILDIKEASGYFGTIFLLLNYFLYTIGKKYFFFLYFINNISGLSLDFVFGNLSNISKKLRTFDEVIYKSLTSNYIMIIKK